MVEDSPLCTRALRRHCGAETTETTQTEEGCMNPELTPSPETQDVQDAPNPKCVYVGTFNGYRCYVEDPEAVAQAIQRAIYRLAEEAEKEGAA